MAIGWLAVLKSVPWSEVIANAPKVADGAKKLWNTVAKKPARSGEADTWAAEAAKEPQSLAALGARCAALEAAVAEMHGQLLASSELINALADQNAQLVQRIEANRRRVLWLGAVASVASIVALLSLALLYSRLGG